MLFSMQYLCSILQVPTLTYYDQVYLTIRNVNCLWYIPLDSKSEHCDVCRKLLIAPYYVLISSLNQWRRARIVFRTKKVHAEITFTLRKNGGYRTSGLSSRLFPVVRQAGWQVGRQKSCCLRKV